jgi:tetratricopeptide (TPR) repeat protein
VAAARRGVRLSPGDARAHFVLGRALLAGGEPVEATRATLSALRLDPDLGMAHMQLAGILAGAGPVAQARAAVAHAVRLDPAVSNGWVDSYLAQLEGRSNEQIALLRDEFERRRAAGEHLEQPAMILAYMNASAGHSAEALSWLARLEGITHNDPMVDLIRMRVMSRLGRPEAVHRLLEAHRPFYERDWQYCTWIAEAYAAAGEPDEALLWIEKAVELGSVDAWSIETMEGLSTLRGDPRLDEAARTLRQRVDDIMALVARTGYS